MGKKIIFLIIFLTMLGAIAVAYLNNIFFPVKFKQIVIEKTEKLLERKVTIENIQFNPFKGFVVDHLKIFDKDSQKLFIQFERAYFKVVYTSLFKDKKIFIPSIIAQKPLFHISRGEDSLWNFQDLIPTPNEEEASPPLLWIGGLSIINGNIHFIDYKDDEVFQEVLTDINLKIKFSFRKAVLFSSSFHIPKNLSNVALEGQYDLTNRQLSTGLTVENLPIEEYYQIYMNKPTLLINKANIQKADLKLFYHPGQNILLEGSLASDHIHIETEKNTIVDGNLKIQQGRMDFKPDGSFQVMSDLELSDAFIKTGPGHHIKGNIFSPETLLISDEKGLELKGTIAIQKAHILANSGQELTSEEIKIEQTHLLIPKDNPLELKTDLGFTESTLSLSQNRTFQGSPTINLHLSYDNELQTFQYDGLINFKKALLTEIPQLGLMRDLKGTLAFANNQLSTKELFFTTLDAPMQLKGALTNFRKPDLDVEVSSNDFNLNTLTQLFPKFFEKKKITITGKSSLQLNYTGPLGNPSKAEVNAQSFLKAATIHSNRLPEPVTELRGEVLYEQKKIIWKNLQGRFRDQVYTLTGKFLDSLPPEVETTLDTDDLNLFVKLIIFREIVDIAFIEGSYFNTQVNVTGDIDLIPNTPPVWNLQGDIKLPFEDLPLLLPHLKEQWVLFNPKGTINLNGSFQGQMQKWREWTLLLTGASPLITIKEYDLKDVTVDISQKDFLANRLNLTADLYEGQLEITGSADLSQEKLPYEFDIKVKGTDLTQAKAQSKWKDKNFSGEVNALASLKGSIAHPNELRGKGSIFIENGLLGEINLLKGLGKFLFIPEFENIVFNQAMMDFLITDDHISTNNFILQSEMMDFIGGGWLKFNGEIDFYVRSQFSPEAIASSRSLKKALTTLLTQTDDYLNIKISGTIQEPRYVVVPNIPGPLNVIDSATDILRGGLQTILEELP